MLFDGEMLPDVELGLTRRGSLTPAVAETILLLGETRSCSCNPSRFSHHGDKLKGKYTILQFGKVKKNWLFFRAKD